MRKTEINQKKNYGNSIGFLLGSPILVISFVDQSAMLISVRFIRGWMKKKIGYFGWRTKRQKWKAALNFFDNLNLFLIENKESFRKE